MKNGHEKLIAKIQHFFDVLTKQMENFNEQSIVHPEKSEREHLRKKTEEMESLRKEYREIFKEFLYDNENGKT